jgi:starvation-inducible DNA-binding protein
MHEENRVAPVLEPSHSRWPHASSCWVGWRRGTARTAALQSGLPEYPGAIVAGHAHVGALAERFASYAAAPWGGMALAADVEDAHRAAVYTETSHGIDKRLWVLDAHLNR